VAYQRWTGEKPRKREDCLVFPLKSSKKLKYGVTVLSTLLTLGGWHVLGHWKRNHEKGGAACLKKSMAIKKSWERGKKRGEKPTFEGEAETSRQENSSSRSVRYGEKLGNKGS